MSNQRLRGREIVPTRSMRRRFGWEEHGSHVAGPLHATAITWPGSGRHEGVQCVLRGQEAAVGRRSEAAGWDEKGSARGRMARCLGRRAGSSGRWDVRGQRRAGCVWDRVGYPAMARHAHVPGQRAGLSRSPLLALLVAVGPHSLLAFMLVYLAFSRFSAAGHLSVPPWGLCRLCWADFMPESRISCLQITYCSADALYSQA